MDLVILAALAIFIFVKLNKKLGEFDDDQKRDSIKNFLKEKANYQQKKAKKSQKYSEVKNSNIVNLHPNQVRKNSYYVPSSEDLDILNAIDQDIISNVRSIFQKTKLSPSVFIDGSKKAFEMITENFSNQDLSKVKNLLTSKIYSQFQENIDELKKNNQKLHSQIISIDGSKIINAKSDSRYAYLTVEFTSQQIDYVMQGDKIINGSKSEEVNIVDKWIFKKNIAAKNPAWLLSSVL
ncbi:Tim44/TimA family putative adaptor protein [Rickettsiales bacterium]|nr:Tim44/TimA family putative adaptor protein [Rickettsiales bacterium]MDB2550710.1 Tim44/TimA family putative adaptor protein [Rickettsiales bacterium]